MAAATHAQGDAAYRTYSCPHSVSECGVPLSRYLRQARSVPSVIVIDRTETTSHMRVCQQPTGRGTTATCRLADAARRHSTEAPTLGPHAYPDLPRRHCIARGAQRGVVRPEELQWLRHARQRAGAGAEQGDKHLNGGRMQAHVGLNQALHKRLEIRLQLPVLFALSPRARARTAMRLRRRAGRRARWWLRRGRPRTSASSPAGGAAGRPAPFALPTLCCPSPLLFAVSFDAGGGADAMDADRRVAMRRFPVRCTCVSARVCVCASARVATT